MLRHSNINTTLEIHTHAGMDSKLVAQQQNDGSNNGLTSGQLKFTGGSRVEENDDDFLGQSQTPCNEGVKW